jgi:hypothetical protein
MTDLKEFFKFFRIMALVVILVVVGMGSLYIFVFHLLNSFVLLTITNVLLTLVGFVVFVSVITVYVMWLTKFMNKRRYE